MTEKSASDVLRELLDERGVEYETDERNAITKWSTYYGAFVFFARQREGKLLVETTVATKHSVILTPEQAIAATLGVDVKDCENLLWGFIGALDVADATDADKKPIVSDYARQIAATLGGAGSGVGSKVGSEVWGEKLTAKQVRKAIFDCSTYANYDGCTYHASGIRLQAITDELNAALRRPKAKSHPYGYERDTGAYDCTRCECGCINDISATYCNDCGGEIEIDESAEKEYYDGCRHTVYAVKHDDGSLEFCERRYVPEDAATLGSEINGDTSDGYHTFDELYYHRTALFACLVALQPRQMAFKSWKHSDGTMYEGMFIAGIYTSGGWCTYHCEAKWWPLFDCHEQEFAPEWDGHTPSDAIHRLMSDFLPSQDVGGEVSE